MYKITIKFCREPGIFSYWICVLLKAIWRANCLRTVFSLGKLLLPCGSVCMFFMWVNKSPCLMYLACECEYLDIEVHRCQRWRVVKKNSTFRLYPLEYFVDTYKVKGIFLNFTTFSQFYNPCVLLWWKPVIDKDFICHYTYVKSKIICFSL